MNKRTQSLIKLKSKCHVLSDKRANIIKGGTSTLSIGGNDEGDYPEPLIGG